MAIGCVPARSSRGEPTEFVQEIHHPNAGHPYRKSITILLPDEAGKEVLESFPADRNEGVADSVLVQIVQKTNDAENLRADQA
jgi:hypothetical protein